jgi:hypothetical protein
MSSFFRSVGCALLLSVALGGCAIGYTDVDGAKHVFGLVKLKIKPSAPERTIGETVEIQSIGIAVYSTPLNRGVAIGYNREITTAIQSQPRMRTGQTLAVETETR